MRFRMIQSNLNLNPCKKKPGLNSNFTFVSHKFGARDSVGIITLFEHYAKGLQNTYIKINPGLKTNKTCCLSNLGIKHILCS